MKPNQLINQKSPYLLQHAYNPVNWFPWSKSSFDLAKAQSKPIFLSIGYSTCHWCHVMAHESFENEQIAQKMNDYFVNIKIDREEMPDVDSVYMSFVQATTGHGGWPLSCWLTPDLKPFYGGTYFSPEDKYGRPGFEKICEIIHHRWENDRQQLLTSSDNVHKSLIEAFSLDEAKQNVPDLLQVARKAFLYYERNFDGLYGGFNIEPKFPTPVNLEFLLTHYALPYDDSKLLKDNSLNMALYTLRKIAMGGIHDHVGLGYHRYSTDKFWHVPHFEKMLYDQAQLMSAFSQAYQISQDRFFLDQIYDIYNYICRDLSHSDGGFYSAQDADSLPKKDSRMKLEGAFAVWTFDEIKCILKKSSEKFCEYFGVKKDGNVPLEKDIQGELKHQNVLMMQKDISTEDQAMIKQCLNDLCAVRNQRPPPHLDDKIITSWNGLMIHGLCQAFKATSDQKFLSSAIQTAAFIQEHLFDLQKKCLIRSYRDQASEIPGVCEDYAFMIQGLISLYEASFDAKYLEFAKQLQQLQDDIFYDNENFGYFQSSDKSLLLRLKNDHDGAEPSANSVSVNNLLRLSALLADSSYMNKAEQTLKAFAERLENHPYTVPQMAASLILYHKGIKSVVIVGKRQDQKVREFVETINRCHLPNVVVQLLEPSQTSALANQFPDLDITENQQVSAHICEKQTCGLPITDVQLLIKELKTN